ncbi:MAG: hypothetical protein WCT24_01140 [Patescibacteria group bacterium]
MNSYVIISFVQAHEQAISNVLLVCLSLTSLALIVHSIRKSMKFRRLLKQKEFALKTSRVVCDILLDQLAHADSSQRARAQEHAELCKRYREAQWHQEMLGGFLYRALDRWFDGLPPTECKFETPDGRTILVKVRETEEGAPVYYVESD